MSLLPTYEGGNPARFCNPNQKNYAGERISVNRTRQSYDGALLVTEEDSFVSVNVLGLMDTIDERKKNYGKKRKVFNWDSFKK